MRQTAGRVFSLVLQCFLVDDVSGDRVVKQFVAHCPSKSVVFLVLLVLHLFPLFFSSVDFFVVEFVVFEQRHVHVESLAISGLPRHTSIGKFVLNSSTRRFSSASFLVLKNNAFAFLKILWEVLFSVLNECSGSSAL